MTITELRNLIREVIQERQGYGLTIQEILTELKRFEGKTLIFFDTETTGLEPNHIFEQVTQIAAMAIDGGNWGMLDRYNEKAQLTSDVRHIIEDPQTQSLIDQLSKLKTLTVPIAGQKKKTNLSPEVQAIIRQANTPASKEFVKQYIRWTKKYKKPPMHPRDVLQMTRSAEGTPEADRPTEKQMLLNFEQFLNKHPGTSILVAQNARFDMKTIQARRKANGLPPMKQYQVFDTMMLSRYFLIPLLKSMQESEWVKQSLTDLRAKTKYESYSTSLGKVANIFKINPTGWHDALADITMMIDVLKNIITLLEQHKEVDIRQAQAKQAARLRRVGHG